MRSRHVSSLIILLALPAVFSAQTAESDPPRSLNYPGDLQEFRRKALKHDGAFAPDIAFFLRTCPKCRNLYVFGTFPRLKRLPFDNLSVVHDTIEAACLKHQPPKTMYSAKTGRMVPRACPVCDEPENDARADKVLFCHRIPESGDDMQIEYEIERGKLGGARTYWRMPAATPGTPSPLTQVLKLPDESEDSIKNAYGHYFSLRAVWAKILATRMDGDKAVYEQVSPGMWFILRPKNLLPYKFTEFGDKQLKPDQEKGVFDRLESPLKVDDTPRPFGTFKDWAATHADSLLSGAVDPYVAISNAAMRKAAADVLATRAVVLEVLPVEKPTLPGSGRIKGGDYYVEITFGPLARETVLAGLSLHQGCAHFLTEPVFAVETTMRLDAALRAQYPGCTFRVEEGRNLVFRDSSNAERKIDVLALSNKLDPNDVFNFGLFCKMMLAWDAKRNAFGPQPLQRDVSPTGLPAFIEKRIRPSGYLASKNSTNSLHEKREDSDGNRYDVCYTSECNITVVLADPVLERFKDLTLEEVQKIYSVTGGILPTYLVGQDALSFPGDALEKAGPCKAYLLCGMDVSSLAADAGRASQLAAMAGFTDADERIHFYALTTHCAVLAPRKLTGDEFKLALSRMKTLAPEALPEKGLDLNLYFDLPRAEPRGTVLRRK